MDDFTYCYETFNRIMDNIDGGYWLGGNYRDMLAELLTKMHEYVTGDYGSVLLGDCIARFAAEYGSME